MQLQFINRKGLSHSGFPENGTKFSRALNFSCANGTLHWRMFSFQSSFEENEICIICRATCFKHKATKELKIKNFDFRSSYQKCSVEKKNRKCHKKTTVSESLFNKFSDIFSLATFELP